MSDEQFKLVVRLSEELHPLALVRLGDLRLALSRAGLALVPVAECSVSPHCTGCPICRFERVTPEAPAQSVEGPLSYPLRDIYHLTITYGDDPVGALRAIRKLCWPTDEP